MRDRYVGPTHYWNRILYSPFPSTGNSCIYDIVETGCFKLYQTELKSLYDTSCLRQPPKICSHVSQMILFKPTSADPRPYCRLQQDIFQCPVAYCSSKLAKILAMNIISVLKHRFNDLVDASFVEIEVPQWEPGCLYKCGLPIIIKSKLRYRNSYLYIRE